MLKIPPVHDTLPAVYVVKPNNTTFTPPTLTIPKAYPPKTNKLQPRAVDKPRVCIYGFDLPITDPHAKGTP